MCDQPGVVLRTGAEAVVEVDKADSDFVAEAFAAAQEAAKQ